MRIIFLLLTLGCGTTTDSSVSSGSQDGAAGQDGENGADGADGADGLHCWDLDGNGEPNVDEDINGDDTVDVLDCRGADGADGAEGTDGADGLDGTGGGFSKEDLYMVTGDSGPVSIAACDDENDILLHGGCTTYHNCVPATLTSRPENTDDPAVISSWYCEATCGAGTSTAIATCIAVDTP